MKILISNKLKYLVIAFIILFVINYKIFTQVLESNYIGVLLSIVMFFWGAKATNKNFQLPLLILIILFEFICIRLQVKSLHFFTFCAFFCITYFYITNKFSTIAIVCLILFSSLFNKFLEQTTVEIKQWLCEGVYLLLKNPLNIKKIEGVSFFINNSKITIDSACMGLSMFKTGFLVLAFFVIQEEKNKQLYYSDFQVFLFSLLVILLNIISNYFRIVLLVVINCIEENVLHHSIGILCFVIYQILPIVFLIRMIKPKQALIEQQKYSSLKPIIFTFIWFVITSVQMYNTKEENILFSLHSNYQIEQGQWVNKEVFKLNKGKCLVYIKTVSHKPLICWTGDGYAIINSTIVKRHNNEVWCNKMKKGTKEYLSYWWYETDRATFTSYIEIMFQKLLFNRPIRLINEVIEVN